MDSRGDGTSCRFGAAVEPHYCRLFSRRGLASPQRDQPSSALRKDAWCVVRIHAGFTKRPAASQMISSGKIDKQSVGGRPLPPAEQGMETLDGGCVTVTAYAREPEQKTKMDAAQVTGTSSSYARKYALNGLFCIDDTKDADTDEYQKQTTSRPNKPAQKQTEAETIPLCACCGKQLQPVQYNNRTVSPLETARSTKKRFGRVLCWDCAQKQPKEG